MANITFEECWSALHNGDYRAIERQIEDDLDDANGVEGQWHSVNVDAIRPRFSGRRTIGYVMELDIRQLNADGPMNRWQDTQFVPRKSA